MGVEEEDQEHTTTTTTRTLSIHGSRMSMDNSAAAAAATAVTHRQRRQQRESALSTDDDAAGSSMMELDGTTTSISSTVCPDANDTVTDAAAAAASATTTATTIGGKGRRQDRNSDGGVDSCNSSSRYASGPTGTVETNDEFDEDSVVVVPGAISVVPTTAATVTTSSSLVSTTTSSSQQQQQQQQQQQEQRRYSQEEEAEGDVEEQRQPQPETDGVSSTDNNNQRHRPSSTSNHANEDADADDQQQQPQERSTLELEAELVTQPVEALVVHIDGESEQFEVAQDGRGGRYRRRQSQQRMSKRNSISENNVGGMFDMARRRSLIMVLVIAVIVLIVVIVIVSITISMTQNNNNNNNQSSDDEQQSSTAGSTDTEIESDSTASSPPPSFPYECYTNFMDINKAQVDVISRPTNETQVFVICPGTRIKIGIPANINTGNWTYINGGPPLQILRDNIVVQCGIDGRQNNGCILDGGQVQIIAQSTLPSLNTFLVTDTTNNVTIRGLTMTGTLVGVGPFTPVSVIVSSPGENFRIEDCVWTNMNPSRGLIFVGANTAETIVGADRSTYKTQVTLSNCTFDNLVYEYPLILAADNTTVLDVENLVVSDVTISTLPSGCPESPFGECSALMFCVTNAQCSIHGSCIDNFEYGLPSIVFSTADDQVSFTGHNTITHGDGNEDRQCDYGSLVPDEDNSNGVALVCTNVFNRSETSCLSR